MSARNKLYAYAGTPSVLPEKMLDEALDAYRAEVLAEAAPLCAVCETSIEWIDCPTGGWWAHGSHPADEHDAQPPGVPSRAEVLHEAAAELDRIADRIEAGTKPGAQMLRDAAGNVRYMARKDTPAGGESTTAEVILPALAPEESCTGIALNGVHTQVFHCRQTADAHELHLWRTGLEWFTCRGEAR